MILAIDFDRTVVRQDRPYDDTTTPLRFQPGAREVLHALKEAGHVLILYSARANRALRIDPNLDPLVRSGARKVNLPQWHKDQVINNARYLQMLQFVRRELPGVFDAVDDGMCGKVVADVYIDDRALRYGNGLGSVDWSEIASMYAHGVAVEAFASVFKSGAQHTTQFKGFMR